MNTYEVKNRLMNIFTQLKSSFNIRFNNLEIVISSRLRSSNGTCAYHYNKWTKEVEFCKIKMSQALLEEFGWERFEKTFRHEVAHLANAERGGKGHDRSFKNLFFYYPCGYIFCGYALSCVELRRFPSLP